MVLFIVVLIYLAYPWISPVSAKESVVQTSAQIKKQIYEPDYREIRLKLFLKSHRSPMVAVSGYLVDMADKYELDYRLIPAIAGVESSFGRAMPPNSYNAYGWNNGKFYFISWEEGVEVVARTLKEKYLNKGRDNVYEIAPMYCPSSSTWAGKVLSFMEEIDRLTILQICP